MKNLILLLSFCLILFECSSDKKSIPVIDLQKSNQLKVVNLSEMIRDIYIVKLETSKESLLGPNTIYLVSKKSIIAIDNEKILQFSDKGQYIKTLAVAGKGPEEFLGIDACALDEVKNILYINHRGDSKNIVAFDLNSGVRIKKIPTGVDNRISQMIVVADSILAIQPRMNKEYNLYYLSTSGKIINGISPPKVRNIGLETSIKKVQNALYYMPKEYDTLYLLSHTSQKPICFFSIDKRFSIDNHVNGNFIYLSLNSTDFMIANKVHANITLNPDGESFTMNGDKVILYWIDKRNNFSINEITGFRNDYFGFDDAFDPWRNYLSVDNNLAFKVYSSIELKRLIEKALQTSKIGKEVKDRISLLYNQVNENDNPVLLVGKLRGTIK